MLNPVLYGKLKQIFGSVEVVDENEKPRLRRKFDKWHFDTNKGSFGETFRVNCPVCGDKKGHLYISALSFTTPVVDGQVFPPAPLIAHCFRRDCFKNNPEDTKVLTEALQTGEQLTLDCIEQEESLFEEDPQKLLRGTDDKTLLQWQPDYHVLEKDAPAEVLDYVARRGIREEDIKELKIGWGKCWNYKKNSFIGTDNWLQFPIIDQTGLRGFQSRQLKDADMKYFFDARTPKKLCLYNRERASKFQVAAIAEGIFDALHIGRCGMAFFGSKPSKGQINLLMQDGYKMVLYVPDQKKHYTNGKLDLDPPAIADEYIMQWNKEKLFEWGAYRIDVPKADAGECTMQEVWEAALKQLNSNDKVPEVALEYLIRKLEEF